MPSCFNEVTGCALHGLVNTMIQLFVDDSTMAVMSMALPYAHMPPIFAFLRLPIEPDYPTVTAILPYDATYHANHAT